MFNLFTPAIQHGAGQWALWPNKHNKFNFYLYPPAMQQCGGMGFWAPKIGTTTFLSCSPLAMQHGFS
jgi:hypothetical protein